MYSVRYRLLKLAGEDVEETEIAGFHAEERTLYCNNVCHNQILQVSSSTPRLGTDKLESR